MNSFESFTHKPGHTTVSMGWGHSLPVDDITNSVNARIPIEEFCLINPDGHKIQLHKPKSDIAKPFISTNDYDIFDADIASQKIALKKEMQKGVYLIEAFSKIGFYTEYIDNKGRKRLSMKSQDKVRDLKKVLFSLQYQAFAKSYLTIGEWITPKPIGHALEIIPLTDLSNVKVGDLVEFNVRFYGKPLSYSPKSIEYITAYSSSFGLSDNFALFSYISAGKAQFRVQSAGQWLVNVFHNENVTKNGQLKKLYNKVTSANCGYGATLTFNVK